MNDQKTYLSQEKYDELTKELESLKTVSRKEVAEKLEYAKSLGDLSENTEYQEARESHANIEERIATIKGLLKSAEIVSEHKSDVVDIGTHVVIKKKNGEEKEFELVGSEESDAALGKISNRSPLGEALLDKKKGDTFTYKTPGGEEKGEILEVK